MVDTTLRGAVSPATTAGDDYWHDELERPWRWSCPRCGSTGAFRTEQRGVIRVKRVRIAVDDDQRANARAGYFDRRLRRRRRASQLSPRSASISASELSGGKGGRFELLTVSIH